MATIDSTMPHSILLAIAIGLLAVSAVGSDASAGGRKQRSNPVEKVRLSQLNTKHRSNPVEKVQIGQINTKTSMVLNEANDGEARESSLMNDFKDHLTKLRKKF